MRIGATCARTKTNTNTCAPGGRAPAKTNTLVMRAFVIIEYMNHLTKTAVMATLHCLTGCAVGEVGGMVLGTIFNWHNLGTIIASIGLAFFFGYLFSTFSLLRSGVEFVSAIKLALAADTLSIVSMEIIDNVIMVLVPGAMDAGLHTVLFWGSLASSLIIAFMLTVPVNRWLIAQGKGHALAHSHHHH